MIIGITGYGATGASAYIDLLKEFEEVQFFDPHVEFQLLQQPDGIADLRYHLVQHKHRISVNAAINRFIKRYHWKRSDRLSRFTDKYVALSDEYIRSLIEVEWMGKSSYDPQDLLSTLESRKFLYPNAVIKRIFRLLKLKKTWPPFRKRYYASPSEEEFIEKTKNYLREVLVSCGFDMEKPIILEQLFCLQNPIEGAEYFDGEVKSIVVDRDPRDVFISVSKYLPWEHNTFMPNNGNVQDFVKYYRGIHGSREYNEKILYVNFEDLIYDYDKTEKKIAEFLGLKHIQYKTKFKPEWSINNTQIFKKHPELEKEIHYIEEQLPEYLFDFEKHKELNFTPENVGVFDAVPGDTKKH